MKKNLAFTLAEVLITLAIIGVVAAMTIPSVIVNTNQSEFKTGLRKAVSVLNQSITMNGALEGETPYDNENLFEYLQQHMSVMSSTTKLGWGDAPNTGTGTTGGNLAFYTTDGMRFEIPSVSESKSVHETVATGIDASYGTSGSAGAGTILFNATKSNNKVNVLGTSMKTIGQCGSYGYNASSDSVVGRTPCLILVDVNGDRKPTPANPTVGQIYKNIYPAPSDKLIKDIFPIIITDEKAIPYGVVAQKAMYQARQK